MLSHVETDEQLNEIDLLLEKVIADGKVDTDRLLSLERAIGCAGPLDRRLAATIFHANRCLNVRSDEWVEWYLGVLSSFFLAPIRQGWSMPEESEACLLAWMGESVEIPNLAERRLAVRLLLKSWARPGRLEQRVFQALENNILHQNQRWLERGERRPGVIDSLDIHLIRRLLSAGDDGERLTVNRLQAEILFSLDRHATEVTDVDAWQRLLGQADVACSTKPH